MTTNQKYPLGRWVLCKGCGEPLGLFLDGFPPNVPRGAVGHAKPVDKENVPRSTGCALFNRSTSAEIIALHADAPDIDPPIEIVPSGKESTYG